MAEALRFPRLSPRGVRLILDDMEACAQLGWRERREQVASMISRAASGGGRVSDDRLDEIREHLVGVATAHGFPDDTRRRTGFDKRAAILLVEEELVPAPEALRDDVWAFITAVLMADVAWWRWANSPDRYRGGVRNTFQRLWLRGTALRRDSLQERWALVEALSEDANLQILERPGVSASRKVTRMIGEVWLEMSNRKPRLPMEEITRQAMLTLLALEQVRPLHALDDLELRTAIQDHFDRSGALV